MASQYTIVLFPARQFVQLERRQLFALKRRERCCGHCRRWRLRVAVSELGDCNHVTTSASNLKHDSTNTKTNNPDIDWRFFAWTNKNWSIFRTFSMKSELIFCTNTGVNWIELNVFWLRPSLPCRLSPQVNNSPSTWEKLKQTRGKNVWNSRDLHFGGLAVF